MKDHYSVFYWPGNGEDISDHFCKLHPISDHHAYLLDATQHVMTSCSGCDRHYGSGIGTDRDWVFYEEKEDGFISIIEPHMHVPFDAFDALHQPVAKNIFDDIGNFSDVM